MQAYRRHIKMTPSAAERKRPGAGLSGSVHLRMLVMALILFIASGCYLYAVNRSAVQGYHLRTLEKEIDKLKQENAELKIAEADLRSLYRIEASEEALEMRKLGAVVYLEGRGHVALLK